MGSPKDFEVGRTGIESKAHRGAATPFVKVSSEYQLDDVGVDELFLHVIELSQAPTDATGAFTLTQVAESVREQLTSLDHSAVEQLQGILSAAGFRWEDDYSDSLWIEGSSRFYEVRDDFPRITGAVAPGVSNVRYSISLSECEPFQVADERVIDALKGRISGDQS